MFYVISRLFMIMKTKVMKYLMSNYQACDALISDSNEFRIQFTFLISLKMK